MAEHFGKSTEWVLSKQQQLQAVHKLTHLKGPRDKITSVVIPGVLLASCVTLVGRGIFHLATGTGLKD